MKTNLTITTKKWKQYEMGSNKKKLFANMKLKHPTTKWTPTLPCNYTTTKPTHTSISNTVFWTLATLPTNQPPTHQTTPLFFNLSWKSALKFAKFKWTTICLQNLLHILRWQFPHIIRNHQNFQRHFKTTTTQQLENKISISLQQHEKSINHQQNQQQQ